MYPLATPQFARDHQHEMLREARLRRLARGDASTDVRVPLLSRIKRQFSAPTIDIATHPVQVCFCTC